MTLEELLNYTETIKNQIINTDLQKDDVRYNFFSLYYSGIYDYYIGKTSFGMIEYFNENDLKLDNQNFPFNFNVKCLTEIQNNQLLMREYEGNLSRNILFNVWTPFEMSISEIYDYLISKEDYVKSILKLNKKIIKAIESLDEENKTIVIDSLMKSTLIPINSKFNRIIKHSKEKYKGDLEDDRNFLDFVIKLRNSIIHANGYYRGKEFYYKFGEDEFFFENNEMLMQKSPLNSDVYLRIAIRIRDIFENLIECIDEIDFIKYPSDKHIFR